MCHLFSIRIVFHQSNGSKKHGALVGPDQFIESFGIPGLHPLNEDLLKHVSLGGERAVYRLRRRADLEHHAFSHCARHRAVSFSC